MIHCFAEVKFKSPANLNKGLDQLRVALCTDKELPVKVEAAIAIQMVLAEQEKGIELIIFSKSLVIFLQ